MDSQETAGDLLAPCASFFLIPLAVKSRKHKRCQVFIVILRQAQSFSAYLASLSTHVWICSFPSRKYTKIFLIRMRLGEQGVLFYVSCRRCVICPDF